MEHREFRRIVPGAKHAVLFLHGIAGTPNHFTQAISLQDLVPEDWSCINVLLPGHGGRVEDFSHSSMKRWREKAFSAFRELAQTHEQVLLVGHSMGTLFSIQIALENPQKVSSLFLLAVPLRPKLGLASINSCLRLVFGCIREDRPMEVAVRTVCGVKTTRKIWKYLGWVPRFLELFWEIYRTEKVLGKLAVPAVAWQSRQDELVSNRTRKVLEKPGVFAIRDLDHSSHFYYAPADAKTLREYFAEEIKKKA